MNKKRIVNFVNKLGIRYKFLFAFLIIIVAVCIMFAISIYNTAKRNEEQALYTARQLVAQTASFLQYKTQNIQNRMEVLAYNENLLDIVNRNSRQYQGNVGQWTLDHRNLTVLTYVVTNDPDVRKLSYYLEDSLAGFAQNEDYHLLKEVEDAAWYRDMMARKECCRWLPAGELSLEAAPDTITMFRTLPSQFSIQKHIGLFRLDVKLASIRDLLNQSVYTPMTSVFVLNRNRNMICMSENSNSKIIDACIALEVDSLHVDSQWVQHVIGNDVYLLGTKPVTGTDWIVYMTIPYKDVMAMSVTAVKQLVNLLIVTLLIAIPLALLLSTTITRRITYMATVMKQAYTNNFAVALHHMGHDEIGQLAESFQYMMGKISTLLHSQYEQGVEIKSLEMKALQAQINPHFLYNTLDLINWMAMDYNATDITDAIYNLSRFYKLSLSKGEDIVSLRDELAHVTSYVNIQNMRFSGKIQLLISIPEQYLDFSCPKIILQPIVENSILHGIMDSERECGIIVISLSDFGEYFSLIVEDDGVGMTAEQQQHLLQMSAESAVRNGYGLHNIDERLKLYYGSDCGISITSTYTKGTCVTLRMRKKLKSDNV